MGDGGRRGGGRDMVLEGRHLLLLFVTVVVLCGVFFTLGYVVRASQGERGVMAAGSAPAEERPAAAIPETKEKAAGDLPQPSEWNFYRAGEAKKPAEEKLAPKRTQAAARPAPAAKSSAMKPPLFAKGAIVLQVAAVTRESDALALATTLQAKEFPAFVLSPAADKFYRVQVGPYADTKSASYAKRALEREGFQAIVRR